MTNATTLEKNHPEVYKILNNYIDQKNLRKTAERYYILGVIYDYDQHFDAEKLYEIIKNNSFNISKATIYNSLDFFLEAGLIVRHYLENNISVYEKAYGYKQHDHFICNNCKSIIEFCDPRIHQIKQSLQEILNVKITSHNLYLHGICSNPKCNK